MGHGPLRVRGQALNDVARGELDLGALADSEEKAQQDKEAGRCSPWSSALRRRWAKRSRKCASLFRLTDSPACLVVGEGDVSGNLERLLKSVGQKAPTVVPTLEVNPHHALVQRLTTESDERLGEWALLLLDQALLAEGGHLEPRRSCVASTR